MAEDGSSLTVRLTRMFGLIDYGLPAYRVNLASDKNPDVPLPLQIEGNCGFTVLQLQVEFKNSEIIQFKSHIQLTIKKLVDSSVSKTFATFDKSPSNVVLLDGVFQKHGNISVYSFEKNEPTHHYVDSNILNSMTFKRVIFNTLNDGISDGIVRSRFLVWGTFSFDSLLVNSSYDGGFPYPFDLLSSSEENELLKTASTADGLEFSNLQIDLQSSLTSPSEVTFLFDTSAICLDSKQI